MCSRTTYLCGTNCPWADAGDKGYLATRSDQITKADWIHSGKLFWENPHLTLSERMSEKILLHSFERAIHHHREQSTDSVTSQHMDRNQSSLG